MKRNSLNLLVDAASMVALVSLVSTGLLMRFVLPPGSRGGAGLSLWGWTRHDWGDFHFYAAALLAIAAGIGVFIAIAQANTQPGASEGGRRVRAGWVSPLDRAEPPQEARP
jgi:hypothetical protein